MKVLCICAKVTEICQYNEYHLLNVFDQGATSPRRRLYARSLAHGLLRGMRSSGGCVHINPGLVLV
jgi:hypothetical protein